MAFNIEETYKIIINENYFFYNIIEYIKFNSEQLPSNNVIPINIYEDFLDKYISNNKNKPEINKIEEALSINSLIQNNIFSNVNQIEGISYVIITQHILDIFQNIFKKHMNALTESQYQEHQLLMLEKRKYFENSSLIKSKELEEEIDTLKKFLERISETLRSSLSALKYQKNNLSKQNDLEVTISGKIKKLKKVKEIQNKYIIPLYRFTSKNSYFIKDFEALRVFLDNKNKLYNVRRLLDFYLKSYLITMKEISEIRKYFNNYINQTEKELYINLGSEDLLNKILEINNVLEDGRRTKYKLWNQNKELKKINTFFYNIPSNIYSHKGIKKDSINQNKFNQYFYYQKELKNENSHKLLTKIFENKQYEEMKIFNELQKKQKEYNKELLYDFKEKLKIINYETEEITSFVLKFLNTKEDKWHIGHFQFLVNKVVKYNKTKNKVILESALFIKNDYKTKYFKFKLKERKNEL